MDKNSPLYPHAKALLQDSSLFRKLDEETRESILEVCEVVKWQKGQTIDSDEGMKYCHIILEGRLKITQIDLITGRSIAPFLLEKGDIYDIFCLLDGKPHEVLPIALDNITALYAPMDQAREWIMMHPQFNEAFLPYLGSLMRHLEAFGESVVFDDTATRLAKLIVRHTLPKEKNDTEYYPVKLINNLSHESLAEMIGSVRSVVNTQLKKLKEEEILLSKRGHLAVKNLERLLQKIERFPL
jgi:CRP-like cAMP-binding protein